MRAEDVVAERQTLEGVIHDELLRRIVSLEYRPGAMIFENSIAAEFEVSRTPVRQAFLRLCEEEMLQILPQRGTRVSRLSVAKVREAQFVRETLEIGAFAKVAASWNESDSACSKVAREISDCIAEQKRSVAEKDYLRFMQLDVEYHNSILRLARNVTLFGIVNHMRLHLNRLRYLELQEAQHEEGAIVFHEDIFAAIRRNDVAGTRRLLSAHLKMLEGFREQIFARHEDIFA